MSEVSTDKKLKGKDLITIGIFSAIYFVINFAFMLLGGNYPEATKQDFKDIIIFMEKYFGKHWDKNKYVKRGVQKVNINSSLSYVVPVFLKFLKYGGFSVWPVIKKVKGS